MALSLVIKGVRELLVQVNRKEVRINPYLPSFRRMAARTIDPAIGAST